MIPRPARRLFLTAAAVYVVDRITKVWAERYLADGPIEIIRGVFRLNYTSNTGGAFGILEGLPWLFAAAAAAVAVAIVWNAGRIRRTWTAVALGLVLGGALGNLTDRLRGGLLLEGRVTDFLDFRVWPVFNLADVAIVVGAAMLAWSSFRRSRTEAEAGAAGDGDA